MRRALIVSVLTLLLSGAGVATAFFMSSGSGRGSALAGDLAAPSAPSVPASVSGTTVAVTWTGVPDPDGGGAVGYWVRRYAGTTPSDACGSTRSSPVLAGTGPKDCNDAGVGSGTYTYSVTAVWRTWTAESPRSASAVVNADTTGPAVTVTFPAPSGVYRAATWDAGCASSICGTASDPSGVSGVGVSVRRGSGNYWDGSAFAGSTEVLNEATGTTSWRLAFPASSFPADGTYTARVVASDPLDNASSVSSSFVYDSTAPTGSVTAPAAGASVRQTVAVASDSADATAGVASVLFQRSPPGGGSWTTIGTDTAGPYSVNLDTTALADGRYDLRATTEDGAGNTFTSASVTVTVDNAAPAVTLTAPANGSTVRTTTPTVSGAAGTATGDVATVTVRLYSGTGTGGALLRTLTITPSGATWSSTLAALTAGTYTAQATQTDSAGNTGTSAPSTFTVPVFAPSGLALANAGGTSGAGKAEKGDTVAITFSRDVGVASLCSTWTGNGTDQTMGGNGTGGSDNVVVTITDSGSNDVLTVTAANCTVNLGSVALGGNYVGSTRTFSGSGGNASSLAWSATSRTLTVTLGNASGSVNASVAAGSPTYTPSAAILDTNGNAVATTPFGAPAASRF